VSSAPRNDREQKIKNEGYASVRQIQKRQQHGRRRQTVGWIFRLLIAQHGCFQFAMLPTLLYTWTNWTDIINLFPIKLIQLDMLPKRVSLFFSAAPQKENKEQKLKKWRIAAGQPRRNTSYAGVRIGIGARRPERGKEAPGSYNPLSPLFSNVPLSYPVTEAVKTPAAFPEPGWFYLVSV
jgi:hypothetical protein